MAGGYSSPGVYKKLVDKSDYLAATGVSIGGTVIRAKKGPVNRPVLVTSPKEFIEAFGEPYYVSGLDDTHPAEAAIGGSLVPEMGYGSYGALQYLAESDSLYVVRAFDDKDKYAAVKIGTGATSTTSTGISVKPLDPSDEGTFDTPSYNSTYEAYYADRHLSDANLLVGYVGPGEDGDNFAVTVETINPDAQWLYSFDNRPTELSATTPVKGFDVPDVWIGSGADARTTSGTTLVTLTVGSNTEDVSLTPENFNTSGATWTVVGATDKDTVPTFDGNKVISDVSIDSTANTWSLSGKYFATDIPLTSAGDVATFSMNGTLTDTTYGAGGSEQVKKYFPIATEVVRLNVYQKPNDKTWDELYINEEDKDADKLRLEPVEVWYGSMTPKLDSNKNELFIEKSINGNSNYIYVKSGRKPFSLTSSWDYTSGFLKDASLPDGTDDRGEFVLNTSKLNKLGEGAVNITSGLFGSDTEFWQYFKDPETTPLTTVFNPSFNDKDKLAVGNLANIRRDIIATNQVGSVMVKDFRKIIELEKFGYPAPAFVALYAGYSEIIDSYNDKTVYIPNALLAGAIMARVDRLTDPWMTPSGVDRATLAVLEQNKRFGKTAIGKMYDKNINSVKYNQGAGFAIWGQKTAQLKKSALDRIQVIRTVIYIQNNISDALNQFVFENNTEQTRLRVYSVLDEFLIGIKASDGLYGYDIVCNDENNPPSVIDQNQMNVDVYIQPVKAAEFIQFTTVVTRTGASLADVKLKYQ